MSFGGQTHSFQDQVFRMTLGSAEGHSETETFVENYKLYYTRITDSS